MCDLGADSYPDCVKDPRTKINFLCGFLFSVPWKTGRIWLSSMFLDYFWNGIHAGLDLVAHVGFGEVCTCGRVSSHLVL